MARVLIVDDDIAICDALLSIMHKQGCEACAANTLGDALTLLRQEDFDVVFLDVQLPDGNGLAIIPDMQKTPAAPDVFIITGQGDPDGAELAIKSGAWHYIEKPLSLKKITLPLERVLQYRAEKAAHHPRVLKLDNIIGSSAAIRKCYEFVARAAGTQAHVLISGETGTGKELFARAMHENSSRSGANFVVLDCTALPEKLAESILFGHVKGAFTGADKAHDGLFLQAHGGTLFIDEVGDLPFALQKTFLRVLQEGCFLPVGGSAELQSDFRVIAATNRDLSAMAGAGQFRSDLMFRLAAMTIELPPLRVRKDDILDIAMYQVKKVSAQLSMRPKGFSGDCVDALLDYEWPGNVRELVNALHSALAAAGQAPVLYAQHLPESMRIKLARMPFEKKAGEEPVKAHQTRYSEQSPSTLNEFKKKSVRQYLIDLMPVVRQDIEKACSISGLSRSRLYALLQEYKIK